jgi:hypothetical protein
MPSNPYLMDRPAVISFSGGRTSGYMLRQILDAFGGTAPGGRGSRLLQHRQGAAGDAGLRGAVLSGMGRADCVAGVHQRWLGPGERVKARGCASRSRPVRSRTGLEVVNYATASRDGRPFVELILGSQLLPNVAMRRCTQWLKIKTSWRYARFAGLARVRERHRPALG